jgi:hypothetical protein
VRTRVAAALCGLWLATGTASAQAPAAGGAPNTLTPAEQAAGWTLLFDGKTTAGWHGFGRDSVVGWEVAGGDLIALGKGGDHANDIVTDAEFEHFELKVDWKLSPRANSGIFFNVVEQGSQMVYATGPEYQLIDDDGWPDTLEDWQKSGANYAMHPPSTQAARPVGQWNTSRIVMDHGRVEHWLNGERVVAYELWTPEWERLVSAGKWMDFPGYGRARKGRIGLQDHGNRVYFRNIKVRTLPARPASKPPGEDWVQLFNGRDLTGWTKVGQEDWSVIDGVIVGKAASSAYGYLQTDREYKDFELHLRFKCVGTGNSGVYFHTRFKPGTVDVSQGAQFEIDCNVNRHTAGVYGFGRGWIVWPAPENETVVRRNEWNELLCVVRGNRYLTRLNGVPMIDFTDPHAPLLDGPIALQLHSGGDGHMQFTDIWIRDLRR